VLASGAAVGAPQWTRLHLFRSSWDPQLVHVSASDPQLIQVTVAKWEPEPAPRSCHCFPFLSSRPIVLLLRQRQPFSGRRVVSNFSSTFRSSWLQYGPVPLTRCPDCPRQEPLKRSIYKIDDNGNRGREFLACESLPYREGDKVRSRSNCSVFSRFSCYSLKFGIYGSRCCFQILKKYRYFKWIDVYVQRLQLQELIGAIGERNLGGGDLL
jgi:hypothetical protein